MARGRDRQRVPVSSKDLVRKRWVGAWVELVVRSGPIGMGWDATGWEIGAEGLKLSQQGQSDFKLGDW